MSGHFSSGGLDSDRSSENKTIVVDLELLAKTRTPASFLPFFRVFFGGRFNSCWESSVLQAGEAVSDCPLLILD